MQPNVIYIFLVCVYALNASLLRKRRMDCSNETHTRERESIFTNYSKIITCDKVTRRRQLWNEIEDIVFLKDRLVKLLVEDETFVLLISPHLLLVTFVRDSSDDDEASHEEFVPRECVLLNWRRGDDDILAAFGSEQSGVIFCKRIIVKKWLEIKSSGSLKWFILCYSQLSLFRFKKSESYLIYTS